MVIQQEELKLVRIHTSQGLLNMSPSELGWFAFCVLILISYGRMVVAGGIPYVNQRKVNKYLRPNKNASFPPMAQLKFGNYFAQFVNGTLMMGTETLEVVDESDNVQIHGLSFRIAGNKMLIGNETLVPREGKDVLLVNGVIMKSDGTLSAGPEQRATSPPSCNVELATCGEEFFADCCGGLRCKGGVCQKCKGRNEPGNMHCYFSEDCSPCFEDSTSFCVTNADGKTRYCCSPPGYLCEKDENCCDGSYCFRVPNEISRCKSTVPCSERHKCVDNSECCNIQECKSGHCECKMGTDCDDKGNGCCMGERCDSSSGKCVCHDDADCQKETDCCKTQNCIQKKCKSCLEENEPCNNNDDCCRETHCYKSFCRINFVKKLTYFVLDNDEPYRVPDDCLIQNTNEGFDGKFIYVCPTYTNKASEAAVQFILDIEECDNVRVDITSGAGGKCRYLTEVVIPDDPGKIYRVEFGKSEPEDLTLGGTAGNINDGRGGDDLYFNWHKVYLDPAHDFD